MHMVDHDDPCVECVPRSCEFEYGIGHDSGDGRLPEKYCSVTQMQSVLDLMKVFAVIDQFISPLMIKVAEDRDR